MKQIAIVVLFIILLPLNSMAELVKTTEIKEFNIDPNVNFLSTGKHIDENYTAYRVILTSFEIYTTISIQKVIPGHEEQEGRVEWSRILDFGKYNMFVTPKDFVDTFQWLSPTSFSFVAEGKKYQLISIGDVTPKLQLIK